MATTLTEAQFRDVARRALAAYDLEPDGALSLLGYRENAVYGVRDRRSGQRFVLRTHRPGYHSPAALRSEVSWMDSLRAHGVDTPRVRRTRSGEPILAVVVPGGPRVYCDLLEWVEGSPPDADDLVSTYRLLGEINARIHAHSQRWTRPAGFARHAWDLDGLIGERPLWGRFDDLPLLEPGQRDLLNDAREKARERLAVLDRAPEHYGLIHADLMPENILVHDGRVCVIDFDDGGFGWNLYDLATSLALHVMREDFAAIRDAWLEGYQRVKPLPASHFAELPTFLMTRALVILGWMATRPETETAQAMGPIAVHLACTIADDYLGRRS